ncbi:MAG: CHAT domain-containing protein [Verrucomicrobiae bacterium]|nr:CHAT domain-containing protein [Verrucomicrobiae bacterium]
MKMKIAGAGILVLLFVLAVIPFGCAFAASKGDAEMKKGLEFYSVKEYSKAADYFHKASSLFEKEKKVLKAAEASYNEGLCRKSTQFDGSETPEERNKMVVDAFDRAALLYSKAKEGTMGINSLLQGAQVLFSSASLSEAETRYKNSHDKAKKLKSSLLQGLSLEGLGKIAIRRGQIGASRKYYTEAQALLKDVPVPRSRVILQMAATLRKSGDMLGTLDCLDEAEKMITDLAKDERNRNLAGLMRFLVLAERGQTFLQMGLFDKARESLQEALEHDEKNPLISEESRMNVEGNHFIADGELGNPLYSAGMLESLRQLAENRGLRDLECTSLISKGRLLRVDGKYADAMNAFETASRIAREAGLTNRNIQVLIAKANLLFFQGMWKESENGYRAAFHDALGQNDMESILISILGVERVARANHIGISGKIDYRKLQGVPWRGAIRQQRKPDGRDIRGSEAINDAWKGLGSLARTWFSGSEPGIQGAITVESVSDLLSWNRMKFSSRYYVADGILRLVSGRVETVAQMADALYGLEEARDSQDEGTETLNEDEWTKAYCACWDALSLGAGKSLIGESGVAPTIQLSGILTIPEASLEQEDAKRGNIVASGALEEVLKKLSLAFNKLSLSKADTALFVNALLRGEQMPEEFRERLINVANRAVETKSRNAERFLAAGKKDELTKSIAIVLNTLWNSPLDEIRESRKMQKMGYIAKIEKETKETREKLAQALSDSMSPFSVFTLEQALEIADIEEAWRNLAMRIALFQSLGLVAESGAKSFEDGVRNIIQLHAKGRGVFHKRFALPDSFSPDTRGAREKRIEQMLSLSEELSNSELLPQLKALTRLVNLPEGEAGFDDRQAMNELVARYILALGDVRKSASLADSIRQNFGFTARSTGGMPNPEVIWRTLLISAKAALAEKDDIAALDFFDQAIDVMDSISSADGTSTQATADKLELYRIAIETAYRRWQSSSSDENAALLWKYLEGMKSRQWREMLSGTGAAFLDRLTKEQRGRFQELHARAAQLGQMITFLSWRQRQAETEQLRTELEGIRRELNEIVSSLTVDFSEEVPLIGGVMEKLHPDWALVDYYISREISFAFVLDKTRWSILELPLDYDSFFLYCYWMRNLDPEYSHVSPNDASSMIAGQTSLRLGDQLFKPILDVIGEKKNILIVPHDLLYVFPYETMALREPDSVKNGHGVYLLDDNWIFAEIPSAFLLHRNKELLSSDPKNANRLVIMANPETWPKPPEDENTNKRFIETYGMDFKEIHKLLLDRLFVKDPYLQRIRRMWCPSIKVLQGTEKERDLISTAWRGFGVVDEFKGSDVSEKNLYDPKNKVWDARYLHIACHGYDRGSIPDLQPGLALSPFEDKGNDSFAQMGEIAAFRWRSELIALSACDTGLGELFIGDGMVGLSTVFLAGGAKGMVISRWRVSDETAPFLMEKMYSEIVSGKASVHALSLAKIAIRRGAHPVPSDTRGTQRTPNDWAVFKFVGVPW